MRSVIETFELATGKVREVLALEGRIEAPNWAPSGDWLLVNGVGRLFRVPLDAPALIPMETGAAIRCNNDHGFSPDGGTIFLGSHHEGQGAQIYRMPAKGGDLARASLEAPSWWHGISPDGKTLTYVAARGGRRVIDVYTLRSGAEEQRLTHGEGQSDGPEFSADGRRIYYNCDRTGQAQIWVMAADGRGQRQLFRDDCVNWFPHPSPDGRHLLYLAYPPGTEGHPADLPVALVLCDPEGGQRRRVREITGGQGTLNVPCWAPDASAFAYVRYEI
ncbi:TolB family protein [Tabrizicola soli]|uniref:TolB family protein n=1 Tax=Tabrizicola soli TaxID=2185115 RepID=A0ABV7DTU8_9RHOB